MTTYIDRLKTTISNVPGSSNGYVIAAPVTGFVTFTAYQDGQTFDIVAVDGVNWEIATGCTYTYSTNTLSRGTFVKSSTGSAINFTSNVLVANTLIAEHILATGNIAAYLLAPDPIGSTTPNSGAFTNLTTTGNLFVSGTSNIFLHQLTSQVTTGTAPFVVASTTNVLNLNASLLNGATFAAPGSIGSTTPNTGAFTTVSATGQITSTQGTGTAPFSVISTTNVPNLNASLLNGATFAAPGSIGSTTPNTGAFTTLAVQHPGSNITATTYTVGASDAVLVFTGTATCTVTLPAASSNSGRILELVTTAAFTIVSASSNVIPATSSTAGTAILAATSGKWARLISNGTNWQIFAYN